ncbi:preprotein translocase subunit SecA [Fodinicola acaciae]|uniref:preprotein translocase subunit SecA n=1 Tax=Fodinicola acaciae TaxID=2681555 RepID=UPI001C9E88C3
MLERILRVGEGRIVRRLKALADTINAIEDEFVDLTDKELAEKTDEYRERYAECETDKEREKCLDDLLPEAFATVREAAKRVLGQRHYDVQLMGGAALHYGNIAEMRTGEGKTLVATLPAYLNALSGKGVHVVTVNDYLAARDAEWMGQVHRFLGLSVGVILAQMTPDERRAAYNCDITYGTNNEFGFDYLRDNMAWSGDELVQRGHNFCIVDEVDSILIDEARTPLIISGPAEQSGKWYTEFARIVPKLQRGEAADNVKKTVETGDYSVDEKKRSVGIHESGIAKVEDQLGIENLYQEDLTPLVGYLNNALKAKELYKRDRDYVIIDGEVLIVDEHTGRILAGRRYNEGMHQAIEAKEGVAIKDENQTLATITLQNYFRMYAKLSGMTGTAMTEAAEFNKVYKVDVVPIPTHKPMQRKDNPDVIYKTEMAKFNAVVEDIVERHEQGQPILVGTVSVEKSELLSKLLLRRGVPHEVLNAKNHLREASIVAQAGRLGAVTVATNMAGRGTDILLGGNAEALADAELRNRGIDRDSDNYDEAWEKALRRAKKEVTLEAEEVLEAGGLYVLGTERHESRRIDNQLRGRSGRQGDPGESRFYLSLGDDLMQRFNANAVEAIMERFNIPEDVPIESKLVTRQILSAQTQIEQQNAEIRKNVLKYDEVLNKQRKVVYAERKKVLDGEDLHEQIRGMIDDVIEAYIVGATSEGYAEDWDMDALLTALKQLYPMSVTLEQLEEEAGGPEALDAEFLTARIREDAQAAYDRREAQIGEEPMRELERQVLLSVFDRKWREHLYEMDYLQEGIGLRAYAQRDPLVEYQREAFDMFATMMDGIKEDAVGFLFNVEVQVQQDEAEAEDRSEAGRIEALKNIAAPRTPQRLEYSAPTLDSEAPTQIMPVIQDEPAAGARRSGPRSTVASGGKQVAPGQKVTGKQTPRNAPCPCGSGKKYKRCHGATEAS